MEGIYGSEGVESEYVWLSLTHEEYQQLCSESMMNRVHLVSELYDSDEEMEVEETTSNNNCTCSSCGSLEDQKLSEELEIEKDGSGSPDDVEKSEPAFAMPKKIKPTISTSTLSATDSDDSLVEHIKSHFMLSLDDRKILSKEQRDLADKVTISLLKEDILEQRKAKETKKTEKKAKALALKKEKRLQTSQVESTRRHSTRVCRPVYGMTDYVTL